MDKEPEEKKASVKKAVKKAATKKEPAEPTRTSKRNVPKLDYDIEKALKLADQADGGSGTGAIPMMLA